VIRRALATLATVLEMIKFEHTLFALPFALIGAVLAARGIPDARTLFWILVAMVGARSAAMAFNRLADRRFDADNPRTAGRALVTGAVSVPAVALFVAASVSLFLLACWRLNPLSLALAPVALAILLGYSFTKRFTVLCHLFLGLALAGAPVGGWVAVRGAIGTPSLLLGAVVLCWVAGFDVLYALQDLDFDRRTGLHSIPARLGVRGALWVSGLLHLVMLGLLLLLPGLYGPGLGTGFAVGVAGCVGLLAYQHWIVRPADLSRLNAAFFTANGVLSVWLLLAVVADVAVR
jgi:4-hydroxybenzoate polyprenyltransferase